MYSGSIRYDGPEVVGGSIRYTGRIFVHYNRAEVYTVYSGSFRYTGRI